MCVHDSKGFKLIPEPSNSALVRLLLWSRFKFHVMVQIAMKLHAALETILPFAQGEDEHSTIVVVVAEGVLLTTAFWAERLLLRDYNCWTSTAGDRCTQAGSMYASALPCSSPGGARQMELWSVGLQAREYEGGGFWVKGGVLCFPHNLSVSKWVYHWISWTQVSAPTLHHVWEIKGGNTLA